jgi:hypothetical protein
MVILSFLWILPRVGRGPILARQYYKYKTMYIYYYNVEV